MDRPVSETTSAEAARHIRGATIAWGAGEYLDLADPDNVRVELDDLAYCLAYTVRWRGQARIRTGPGPFDLRRPFYGVGQHVVHGTEEMLAAGLGEENARAFLFHESDEVPLGDFPGPAKRIPCVKEVTLHAGRIGAAIDRQYGITCPDPDLIKRWDIRMLVTEQRDLLWTGFQRDVWHNGGSGGTTSSEGYEPFERRIVPYSHPEEAAVRFLELCDQLGIEAVQ